MAIASLRSILTLKPPLTHCCAASLPENSPRCTSDLPTIAAVTAPIPMMNGGIDPPNLALHVIDKRTLAKAMSRE